MDFVPDFAASGVRSDKQAFRTRALAAAALAILALLAVVAATAVHRAAPKRSTLAAMHRPLPPMAVFDRGGHQVDLVSIAPGTRRVFVFYSPSCEVCQRELPNVRPFPPSLRLVLVSVTDELRDPFAQWPEVHQALVDRDGAFRRSIPLAGVPLMLFVDEHGVLRDALLGDRGKNALREHLERFARGGASS